MTLNAILIIGDIVVFTLNVGGGVFVASVTGISQKIGRGVRMTGLAGSSALVILGEGMDSIIYSRSPPGGVMTFRTSCTQRAKVGIFSLMAGIAVVLRCLCRPR